MQSVEQIMAEGFTYEQAYRLWKSMLPANVQDHLNAATHANDDAKAALDHVLSEQAAGVVAERDWVHTIKRDTRHCTYCGELFVVACACKTSFFATR